MIHSPAMSGLEILRAAASVNQVADAQVSMTDRDHSSSREMKMHVAIPALDIVFDGDADAKACSYRNTNCQCLQAEKLIKMWAIIAWRHSIGQGFTCSCPKQ